MLAYLLMPAAAAMAATCRASSSTPGSSRRPSSTLTLNVVSPSSAASCLRGSRKQGHARSMPFMQAQLRCNLHSSVHSGGVHGAHLAAAGHALLTLLTPQCRPPPLA